MPMPPPIEKNSMPWSSLSSSDERGDFFDRLDEGVDGGELRADVHLEAPRS